MSTFHPATSSLANFKNTISTISTSRFFVYISSRQEPTFVMASQLELFLPANSYTTHLLSSIRATNEGIAVLEVWSIFPFAIKRILGIKRIFPCSFANKRMRGFSWFKWVKIQIAEVLNVVAMKAQRCSVHQKNGDTEICYRHTCSYRNYSN